MRLVQCLSATIRTNAAINVHDGLGYVSSANGNTLTLIASAMRLQAGDVLAFKNEKFENTTATAKIVSVKALEGITKEVVVENLPESVTEGWTAYNTECNSGNYVIANNYFHENRARGLLLQSSNGLCENNRFYKTMAQAIKVVMDIEPTLWQEGTGVDNLIIRNNTFEKCNYSDWGSVIEIGTNIAGKSAETAVFTNIEISSNCFKDIPSMLMRTNNINGLVFTDNTVDTGDFFESVSIQGRLQLGEYCSNITYADNIFTNGGFLRYKEIAKADSIRVWTQVNSQLLNS